MKRGNPFLFPNHVGFDTAYVAVIDLKLNKKLRKITRNGSLTLIARTEGGREIQKMDVFIDGKRLSQKSDQPISPKPGNYMVSLEKILVFAGLVYLFIQKYFRFLKEGGFQ